MLSERLGMFVHAFTLYWSVRPFGAAALVGVYDKPNGEKPALYLIEPAGVVTKYHG